MAQPTPPDEPSGIDPLIGRQIGRGGHESSGSVTRSGRPRAGARRHGASGAGRAARTHAARGARAVALTASVLATGAVGSALAYSEGAWSADGGAVDDGFVESTGVGTAVDDDAAETPSGATEVANDVATAPDDRRPSSDDRSAGRHRPRARTTTDPETTTETDLGSSGYADGVYLGTSEYTEWGDVQVEVTVSDGRIVDVAAVDYPQGRKSSEINSRAIPLLEVRRDRTAER